MRPKEDSLKKRYVFKLFSNILGFSMSLVTQAIIPRSLGPGAYGNYNFLTSFFTQVVGFFDMGTSLGFYTKLSQRPKEAGLVTFYLKYFTGIIALVMLALLVLTQATSVYTKVWPGQSIFYIYLAAFWGICTWVSEVFNKMVDAYGITVYAEKMRMAQKFFGVAVVLALFFSNRLNLASLFYYNYLIIFFLAAALVYGIKKSGFPIMSDWHLPLSKIKAYFIEFYSYSHPLFVYSLVGLIVSVFDRWLLQVCGGSVQQGFFGLSYQIGGACFLFTSAMTYLMTREFSIAHDRNDLDHMAHLFHRYVPLLYSITAFFCCFIAVQAGSVVQIFGGNAYKEAVIVLTIMAFFPIHQTYGQLSGSIFFATGKTALFRDIGIIFMLIGLPVTYFFIAPVNKFGFDAGATGLAIKMVAMQFAAVNVFLYFNVRMLKLSFWRYFSHQILSVTLLLVLAGLAGFVSNLLPVSRHNVIPGFLLSGFLYCAMVALLIYKAPLVFGLKRDDARSLIREVLKRVTGNA